MVNTRRTTDNRHSAEERNHEEMIILMQDDLNQLIHQAIQEALRHNQTPPIPTADVPLGA